MKEKHGWAIVQYWLQETITSWVIPYSVWKPLESILNLAHENFSREEHSKEIYEAIDIIYRNMYGLDGDYETAPWHCYTHRGSSPPINKFISVLYLTGSDPC